MLRGCKSPGHFLLRAMTSVVVFLPPRKTSKARDTEGRLELNSKYQYRNPKQYLNSNMKILNIRPFGVFGLAPANFV